MKFDTVIFDLDGTLLNTLEDLTDSVNYALSKYNYPTHTIEDVRYFVGSGIKVLIERATPKDITNFDEVFNTFVEHYGVNKNNKTSLYEGVLETLEKLSKMNIKMAVVSNKYHQGVVEICKPLFSKYMNVFIGEQDRIPKKPNKDMVILAIEQLGSDINKTVYVGDSDIDIYTANNTNIPCIGASWGFRGEAFLRELGATYIANKFEDIIEILKNA